MDETAHVIVVDGGAAQRIFRGVEPTSFLLAVLATSPPPADLGDCVVSLGAEAGSESQSLLVELRGSGAKEVGEALMGAFERLGVGASPGAGAGDLTLRPVARAAAGNWVEP